MLSVPDRPTKSGKGLQSYLNHMELVTLNVFKSKIAALESRYYRI